MSEVTLYQAIGRELASVVANYTMDDLSRGGELPIALFFFSVIALSNFCKVTTKIDLSTVI